MGMDDLEDDPVESEEKGEVDLEGELVSALKEIESLNLRVRNRKRFF